MGKTDGHRVLFPATAITKWVEIWQYRVDWTRIGVLFWQGIQALAKIRRQCVNTQRTFQRRGGAPNMCTLLAV